MVDTEPGESSPNLPEQEIEGPIFLASSRISGPSARTLLRSAISSLLLCIGLALIGAVLLAIPAVLSAWLIRALSACILLSLTWAVLGYLSGRVQGRREATAGYTSLPNRYRELPQFDVRSGKTLRKAGDRYRHPYEHVR